METTVDAGTATLRTAAAASTWLTAPLTTAEVDATGVPSNDVSAACAGVKNDGPPPPTNGRARTSTVAKTVPKITVRFMVKSPRTKLSSTPLPPERCRVGKATPSDRGKQAALRRKQQKRASRPPEWGPIS